MITLDNKLIITKMHLREKPRIISALYENGILMELTCEEETAGQLLGNIYIGRVKNIVENIQAAFVEISNQVICYLAFQDLKNPIFTSVKTGNTLKVGDELLVQVSKEAVKTKAPVVTTNLNFTGKYAVLTTGSQRIGVSAKIPEDRKAELKALVEPFAAQDYGFVVRTNAKAASEEELRKEIRQLTGQYRELCEIAAHRPCFSLLHKALEGHMTHLRDTYMESLDEILTDDPALYEEMLSYLSCKQPEDQKKLKLYHDPFPLIKLYNLESALQDALKERVWLKSGAYLVIQQTEALAVIDVNTGKFSGHKQMQDTFLKINLEAAEEIARQIRLRNLSGIIIVDFIDMERSQDRQMLMDSFHHALKQDPVKTSLVGISKLNLVELTRKKIRRPLGEQLTQACPVCHGSGFLY